MGSDRLLVIMPKQEDLLVPLPCACEESALKAKFSKKKRKLTISFPDTGTESVDDSAAEAVDEQDASPPPKSRATTAPRTSSTRARG